jgi:alkylation response protein AidB-like acyl-CoA dehydrogenase
MNFEYSEEQQQLADALRKYLTNEYDFEKRKAIIRSDSGASDTVWSTFAEMGLTAIALPESDGGFGGGAVDLMAAMEACGEALVVEPLLDNVGLAARLVSQAGSTEQRAALLPGVAAGTRRMAFAYLEPGRRYETAPQGTTARAEGGGWILDGEKSVVIGAPSADQLIVSARTGQGTSLFVVDRTTPGVTLNACRTVDGQRAADIRFSGVKLPAQSLLGKADAAQPVIEDTLDFATALLCADAIGAMKFANDTTLEYLKTRKQFGVAIGTFQALQHRPGRAQACGVSCQDQGGGRCSSGEPGVGAVARWHGHDRGNEGLALLSPSDHHHPPLRRRRPSPRALCLAELRPTRATPPRGPGPLATGPVRAPKRLHRLRPQHAAHAPQHG